MSDRHVADELAIRSLAAAYTDAVNRNDLDGMVEVYTDDAVLAPFGGPEVQGREAIREIIGKMISGYQWMFQMTHSGLVRIQGDTAECRWWVTENAMRQDGRGTQFMITYQDKVVRTPLGWRYSRRDLDAIFLRRTSFEGRGFDRPAFKSGLWPCE